MSANTLIEIPPGGASMTVGAGGAINIEATGYVLIKDSAYLKFGDGSDVTIQWNGSVLIITGLPTSNPTVAGALWLNSNVLTLSAG